MLPVQGAEAPTQQYSPLAVQAELDELYAKLKDAHYDLFARRSREDYDRRYLALRRSFDTPMRPLEIQKQFQRFVAYGNVAHAQIPLPFGEFREFIDAGGRILPFSVRVIDDRVFITQHASGVDALRPGAELLEVNGRPALDWLTDLERYISADHPQLAHGLLEFWLEALVWLEYGEPETLTITVREAVREAAGKPREFVIPFRSIEAIRETRRQQPDIEPGADFNTREVRLLDDGIAYLRPGPFYNTGGEPMWDDTAFRAFIDAAFEKILEAKSKDLLIDLRNNPGGDKSFSDLMVAWIADRDFQFYSTFQFKVSEPTRNAILEREETYAGLPEASRRLMREMAELVRTHDDGEIVALDIGDASPRPAPRFEGRVYALINRHSYSNATAVAALLQDYGFATLLGETTDDLPSSYGAAEKFTLSRTGIDVHYPKSWFVRPNGDARVQGVVPDIRIPSPVVETAEDRVLASAMEHIQQRR